MINTLTAIYTSGLVMLGYKNFLLAVNTDSPASLINWFAGVVSVVAAGVCVAMVKHMSNEDKHIPKDLSIRRFMSAEQCNMTRDLLDKKIDDMKIELTSKIEDSKKDSLREIRHTRMLIQLLLKQNGIQAPELTAFDE